MKIYRRYFKVTSGPVVAAAIENVQFNKCARDEYSRILKDIGANENQFYQQDDVIVGIIFDTKPDGGVYKRVCSGKAWWPKQNCKEGKLLFKRFRDVEIKGPNEPLKHANLPYGNFSPIMFGDGKAWSAVMLFLPWGGNETVIISVPWMDENPDILSDYVSKKDKGTHFNSNLDHLLWKPTPEMVEIKLWQYEKEIDDWNEHVRSSNQESSHAS